MALALPSTRTEWVGVLSIVAPRASRYPISGGLEDGPAR